MSRRKRGSFTVGGEVANLRHVRRRLSLEQMLVDAGSEHTWIPEAVLLELGIVPVKKDLAFQRANGEKVTRSIGYAFLRVGEFFTVDEVVFGQLGDPTVLGARTLAGFGVRVDARARRLVPSGPRPVAPARAAHGRELVNA